MSFGKRPGGVKIGGARNERMSVCIDVCMTLCICANTDMPAFRQVSISKQVCMCIYIHTCMHVYAHKYIHCICIHMYAFICLFTLLDYMCICLAVIYICKYTGIRICICVCIYIYICMYMHKH